MSGARQLPGMDYAALKAATRRLLKPLTGRGAADATRVCQQTLSSYGNVGDTRFAEVFMPIDVVADLEAELGDFPVTRALADLNNCLLVPLPEGRSLSPLLALSGKSARQMGELTESIINAVADGRVTSDEGRPIVAQIRDLMVHLASLAEQVKAETDHHDSGARHD